MLWKNVINIGVDNPVGTCVCFSFNACVYACSFESEVARHNFQFVETSWKGTVNRSWNNERLLIDWARKIRQKLQVAGGENVNTFFCFSPD